MKALTVVVLVLAALASADPSHFAGRISKRVPEPVAELPAVTCPAAIFSSTVRVLESSSLTEEQPHIINFEIASALDASGFVDLHYKINNGEVVNVRMNKLSEKLFNFGNIMLRPGDKLEYQFTYCIMINGRQVDCDTEWFSFEMPRPQPVMTKKEKPEPVAELPPISCPALTFGQTVALSASADASSETKLHEVRFEITSNIDASGFVDLHYKINDGELINVRMNKLSEKLFNFEILLRAGDKLDYFMTYCVMINGRQVDCDTAWFSFEMPRPQPVMTKKHKPEPVQEECKVLEISSSLLSTGAATTKKDASLLKIRFQSHTDVQMMGFVDLHYKVNNGELVNVRMNKLSDEVWEYNLPELKTGDKIDFFFTYCYALGSLLCDFNTAMESLTVS